MKYKDHKIIEKLSNKGLDASIPKGAPRDEIAPDYPDQRSGIVRIERSSQGSNEDFQTMQEQHNANHALYYFSIISDAAVSGRSSGNDCEKVRRIIEHMMSLREFIGDDKAGLMEVINALLGDLRKFCPMRRKQFYAFIYENWSRILKFAEAYGHHDRCFPKDKYQKLHDVVSGKCYLKLWWWKQKIRKIDIRIKKILKEVAK